MEKMAISCLIRNKPNTTCSIKHLYRKNQPQCCVTFAQLPMHIDTEMRKMHTWYSIVTKSIKHDGSV